MKTRIAILVLIGGFLFVLSGGQAQEKSEPPAKKRHRILYVVKNADPPVLADILGKHFKSDAEVLAAPAGAGNALLVSGTPAAVEEIVKLLDELDRSPKTVEVDVVLAEVPAKKADAKDMPELDLSGPDVLTRLEAMVKAGQVGSVQRVKLTATEGQPITSTTGGNKPFTSSVVRGGGGFGAGGPVQRSVTYQSVGTTVHLLARVGAGDTVMVELDLRDSQAKLPEAGEEAGTPSLDNSTLTTKLRVPSGRAAVARAVRTEAKAGRTTSLVIVTARVVDPAAAGNKQ